MTGLSAPRRKSCIELFFAPHDLVRSCVDRDLRQTLGFRWIPRQRRSPNVTSRGKRILLGPYARLRLERASLAPGGNLAGGVPRRPPASPTAARSRCPQPLSARATCGGRSPPNVYPRGEDGAQDVSTFSLVLLTQNCANTFKCARTRRRSSKRSEPAMP